MNFSVCGIDSNDKITKNNAKIVFYTFVNFECLYSGMIKMIIIQELKVQFILVTNFCWLCNDIKEPVKPFHVIIKYYKSNTCFLQQAYGRTAKQGQKGSV